MLDRLICGDQLGHGMAAFGDEDGFAEAGAPDQFREMGLSFVGCNTYHRILDFNGELSLSHQYRGVNAKVRGNKATIGHFGLFVKSGTKYTPPIYSPGYAIHADTRIAGTAAA